MFLIAVSKKGIIDIVEKCKNKMSTDCDDIDITVVKRVIEGVFQSLSFMCNLSFQTGKFPGLTFE